MTKTSGITQHQGENAKQKSYSGMYYIKMNKDAHLRETSGPKHHNRGTPSPASNRPGEGGGRVGPPRVQAHLGAAAPGLPPLGPTFL